MATDDLLLPKRPEHPGTQTDDRGRPLPRSTPPPGGHRTLGPVVQTFYEGEGRRGGKRTIVTCRDRRGYLLVQVRDKFLERDFASELNLFSRAAGLIRGAIYFALLPGPAGHVSGGTYVAPGYERNPLEVEIIHHHGEPQLEFRTLKADGSFRYKALRGREVLEGLYNALGSILNQTHETGVSQ